MSAWRRDTAFRLLRFLVERWGPRLSAADRRALRGRLEDVAELDFAEERILLHVDSSLEEELRLRSCSKEPMTVRWLKEELRPGDVFYDIGANVGPYSLVAAKVSGGRARVFALEPSFQNYHQLCRNIILNGCQGSVLPLPIPLCRNTRLDWFHYENVEPGGALHSFSRAVDYKAEEFRPEVSLGAVGFSLDDLVRIAGLPPPTLLKVDVDGLEGDILAGAGEVLGGEGLRSLLIEINEDLPGQADSTIELLAQRRLAAREKHLLTRGLHNYIFVRHEAMGGAPRAAGEVPLTSRRR